LSRFLILNRFDDGFGEYHRFAEPGDRLAYITTEAGAAPLDQSAALATVVVPSMDLETVLPAARELTARHGAFDGIVAISEFDLTAAARLRAELGTPGWQPDFVAGFRDKPTMKDRVAAAGIRVPRFLVLDRDSTAEDVVAKLGLPVIFKPRSGAASIGVVRAVTTRQLAEAMARVDPEGFECEEHINGDVYHIDGTRRYGEYHFVSASVYLNSCLDFALGAPVGSVLLDDGPRKDQVVAFTARCLDALALTDGAFHLELFIDEEGDLVFCEVGLRPGGAEIPYLHLDVFGIDLVGEAYRAITGQPPLGMSPPRHPAPSGGWMLAAEPRPLPSTVIYHRSMLGTVPGLYAESLPPIGEKFDGKGSYKHAGGHFRFTGPDFGTVRLAVLEVMARYFVLGEPAAG
jgi:biotin carboxylase